MNKKQKATKHWKPLVLHVSSPHGKTVVGYDNNELEIFQLQLENYRSSRKLVAAFIRGERIY